MDIVERLDNVDVFAHGGMEDLFEDASVEIGRLRFELAKTEIRVGILEDAIFEYACSVIKAEGISFLNWMETPHLQEAIIAILDARDPNWRNR